ncbi:prostaglandin D2 receptor-like [Acyrthosiphon pisum]|uniref:G-protein coupled receptors family 1 profile domain-containing protein n=1 Tax=Acyrthosiphon pisum TaxID=7029 RepID=A0A8R2AID2_ACYPI|nr:prostaglandin D2 receptor-like [Acyrthosiphon pisum]|eukprot:XP_003248297.1 PREDICTED: prostaglandin D2 receptor-like [Acyrthosiphon pisum]
MELAVTNETTSSSPATPVLPVFWVNLFTYAFYIFGIFGNLLSLFILHRARSSANKRHVFMLHCLLTNDCFLLVGHLVLTFVHNTWINNNNNLWMCRSCVLFRFFVWGAVCAAIVMAVDRWLALTKPFFYLKHINFRLMKRTIVILWFEVLCLVCAPFFGFGLYWDETQCKDFQDAEKPLDVLYFYLYFGHGVILTIAMVYTNLAVMKALCVKDSHIQNNHNELIRHIHHQGSSMTHNWLTEEERSFGWFVLLVCVGFVTLWVPQMFATLLTRFIADKSAIKQIKMAVGVLLAIHFVLNPYLNVLHHWKLVKSTCSRPKNINASGGSANGSRSVSLRTTYKVSTPQML